MKPTTNLPADVSMPIPTTKASSVAFNPNDIEVERIYFHHFFREVCPRFVVTPHNEDALNRAFLYSLNLSRELDFEKGLWIWGDIGCGKSALLKVMARFHLQLSRMKNTADESIPKYNLQGFRVLNCPRIAADFANRGLPAITSITDNHGDPYTVGLDELGREPIPIKHFGNEMNVMEFVLQLRYEQRHKCRTHVTTNLNPEGVRRLYGTYIYDRMQEMFNLIHLSGPSFRTNPLLGRE